MWTVWSCPAALARSGKFYLKVDRPEIQDLRWRGERVTGEPEDWREAVWTSAGFEIDLGATDALHVFVRGRVMRDLVRDWVVDERVAVTSPLLPAVRAESRWNYGRLILLGALGGGLGWLLRGREVLLGRGGSGEVYRARRGWRQVAVKRLRFADGERLGREIEVYGKLSHPHIVRLLASGPDFLTMELMSGGNLRSRLGRAFEFGEALVLLEPLFAAVDYAHSQGVVHRDLKPENILFDGQGVLKIADFGLAKSLESATFTETGLAPGSPAYMAPEQIQGCSRDPRIDQYALGILTFQVLTGRLPFEPPWLESHLHQPVPSVREQLGGELDGVLRRMLEKRPELRYPSVAEAWRALRRIGETDESLA
jgi:hypothetical protein